MKLALFQTATALSLALAAAPAAAAPNLPPQDPIEVLAIDGGPGGLTGPGGERLRSELADVQFIALGEDHGLADPPRLAEALAAEAGRIKGAPLYHAVEVGPTATRQVAGELSKGGLPALDRLLDGQPFAMPFLTNAEDAQLALPFARSGRLWGIDQEFIGSTVLLADRLAALTKDPQVRSQLAGWRARDKASLTAGKFGEAVLTATDIAAFKALRPAFKGNREALRILDDLAESARIYQYNDAERYAENNEERSHLMQGYFLERYRAVKGARPRVLFKMGAYHLGRGTTPTSLYDLGSILPGLAAAQGKRSLHIAFVPIAGKVRGISPSAQGFTAVQEYREDAVPKLLEAAGIAPSAVPAQGWVLIPLKPIRQRLTGKQRRAMGDFATFMVLGFDYLVTTRDAEPATHFEAWIPAAQGTR